MTIKTSLTKSEKLAVLEKAVELGADIHIFIGNLKDKEAAYEIARQLSPMMSSEVVEKQSGSLKWLRISSSNISESMDISIEYQET